MGIAKRHTERGREQAGMSWEGQRTMEKVLENTVRDSEGFSSVVPSFKTLIQHRDVAEPANEASIVWRGLCDPKSHMIIQPELSGRRI